MDIPTIHVNGFFFTSSAVPNFITFLSVIPFFLNGLLRILALPGPAGKKKRLLQEVLQNRTTWSFSLSQGMVFRYTIKTI